MGASLLAGRGRHALRATVSASQQQTLTSGARLAQGLAGRGDGYHIAASTGGVLVFLKRKNLVTVLRGYLTPKEKCSQLSLKLSV